MVATVTKVCPIATDPPEMSGWLDAMTEDERGVILDLKRQLIDARRYVGARSQPPYTFRSAHLHEGVLVGGAHSIVELERYFGQS